VADESAHHISAEGLAALDFRASTGDRGVLAELRETAGSVVALTNSGSADSVRAGCRIRH
jgi:hypothetical protein